MQLIVTDTKIHINEICGIIIHIKLVGININVNGIIKIIMSWKS